GTHASVWAAIVMDMEKGGGRSARIVLGGVAPIPWRLAEVEKMLAGRRVTPALAAQAGEASVAGARALAKNAYKVPMTRAMVRRTVEQLAPRPGTAAMGDGVRGIVRPAAARARTRRHRGPFLSGARRRGSLRASHTRRHPFHRPIRRRRRAALRASRSRVPRRRRIAARARRLDRAWSRR